MPGPPWRERRKRAAQVGNQLAPRSIFVLNHQHKLWPYYTGQVSPTAVRPAVRFFVWSRISNLRYGRPTVRATVVPSKCTPEVTASGPDIPAVCPAVSCKLQAAYSKSQEIQSAQSAVAPLLEMIEIVGYWARILGLQAAVKHARVIPHAGRNLRSSAVQGRFSTAESSKGIRTKQVFSNAGLLTVS